jgi:hypothetical protein
MMIPKKRKRIISNSKTKFPGYPAYPKNEDIYNTDREETELNPEDITRKKDQKSPMIGSLGADLDVPGAELDDAQEAVGNEDEENNYYSLGGDDHNDLEEDNG